MPLFKVQDNRYINTDHVADITYGAAISHQVQFVGPDKVEARSLSPMHSLAHLRIELKSSEEIKLSGEDAERVWEAFQRAIEEKPQDTKH
jgi:hypothetical protein